MLPLHKANKSSLTFWVLMSLTLGAFCWMTGGLLFDPIMIDDPDWKRSYLKFAQAADQLHEAGIAVGSVLAAFTMMVAHLASKEPRSKLQTTYFSLVSFSSIAFVCAVCASGLYLFVQEILDVFKDESVIIRHAESLGNLTILAALSGFLGILSFLLAFGIQGRLQHCSWSSHGCVCPTRFRAHGRGRHSSPQRHFLG